MSVGRRGKGAGGWSVRLGQPPRVLAVFERPDRGGAAFARWADPEKTGRERRTVRALGLTVRDAETGELDAKRVDEAEARAGALYRAVFGADPDELVTGPEVPLQAGLAVALAPGGMYPRATKRAREAARYASVLTELLGSDTPWSALDERVLAAGWRALASRHGQTGRGGPAAAAETFQFLFAVARWLRIRRLIPDGACLPPSRWRSRLAADWTRLVGVRPHRP